MIHIGTVGSGTVVDNFFDAISRIPGMEVSCVYSRDAGKAKDFAARHGVERFTADREAFLDDPSLDFIYIASPNSLHCRWAVDAMKAGRNVICEKPFASTPKEAGQMIGLSKEKGLFLFEAITVPHLPNYKLLKGYLDDIGSIKLVQLNFSQYSSRYQAFLDGRNPNVFNPEFSGGCLMDINYYNLCFVLGLFGAPKEVRYYANITQCGIDTSGVLILGYDGFICEASAAKDSRSDNGALIQGDKGYIRMGSESSRCLYFDLYLGSGGQLHFNEQEDENPLFYEMCDFKNIYESVDLESRDKLLEGTLLAMNITKAARYDAGIYFPADNI